MKITEPFALGLKLTIISAIGTLDQMRVSARRVAVQIVITFCTSVGAASCKSNQGGVGT
jgi:hypothetical protein